LIEVASAHYQNGVLMQCKKLEAIAHTQLHLAWITRRRNHTGVGVYIVVKSVCGCIKATQGTDVLLAQGFGCVPAFVQQVGYVKYISRQFYFLCAEGSELFAYPQIPQAKNPLP
jgi:hypothetical protein